MSGEGVDRTLLHRQLQATRAQRLQSMIGGVRNMERLFRALRPGLEPNETFRALHAASVDYVLIGTFASAVWGSSSIPMVLQICFDDTPTNRENLAQAFGLPVAPTADFFMAATASRRLLVPPDTPILRATPSRLTLRARPFTVPSLDDLMRIMRASGTPTNRVELEILEALKQERALHPPASE